MPFLRRLSSFFRYWGITLIACFVVFSEAYAQSEIVSLPIQFNQYMNGYALYNTAMACRNEKMEFRSGNQRQSGNWSGITSYFATANYRFNNYNDSIIGNKHILGAKLLTDYEGTYLSRTRIYGSYSFHTQLNTGLWLAAGSNLGLMNFSVQGSALSGDGSDTNIDGDVGFSAYNNVFRVGFSINQIFNSKLQPYEEITRLKRHYNLVAETAFDLGAFVVCKPGFNLRYLNQDVYNLDVSGVLIFDELINAGINYRSKKAWVIMAGLEKFSVGENGEMKLVLSYNIPLPQANIFNTRQYEVSVSYFFR